MQLNFTPVAAWVEPMSESNHTTNWPDLAIGLYDRLTGRGAQIHYEFARLRVKVPSGTGAEAEHALWVVNGGSKITTSEPGGDPSAKGQSPPKS